MADNILLNAGSGGSTLAADDVASVWYQQVKLVDGTADSTTPINVGNGTAANALRVTVASDTTGVLSIDDNGGSITVDNADITSIKTAVEIIDNAISGSEMQVDVVAALPAGDNNIGNVDIASSVALDVSAATVTVDLGANNDVTATGNVAHDAADSGSPIKIGGKAYAFDGTAPQTAVAESDRVNAIFTPEGRQYVETSHPRYFNASVDYAAAQTNATVQAAPGAGVKLYITDVIVSNGATAGNVTLLDGSGGSVVLELYPAINGGLTHSFRTPIALTANTLLAITSTTVTTHSVTVSGYIAA